MRFQYPIFQTVIVAVFLLLSMLPVNCFGQIPIVRRLLLNDVGAARTDRAGNGYVEINPFRCRQLGPALCEFFTQHEYGHVNLGHLNRRVSTRRAESEADCYAAKAVSPSVAQAAINYFQSGAGGSRLHGSSQQRAARVANCSQQTTSVVKRNPIRRIIPSRRLSAGATIRSTNATRTVRPRITRTIVQNRPLVRRIQPSRSSNVVRYVQPRTRVTSYPIRNVVYRGR